MFRLLYRLVAVLARFAVRSGRAKDLEIVELRHQLAVLRRQIERPVICGEDRALLGAIAAALPRHPRHPADMAPPTHRPPLDTPNSTTRTTIH